MQITTNNMLIASQYGAYSTRSAGTDASAAQNSAGGRQNFQPMQFRAATTEDVVSISSPQAAPAASASATPAPARTDGIAGTSGMADTTTAESSTPASGGGKTIGSMIDITV